MKTTHTVVILSEKVQKYFQSNIITNVIDKTGPAHCPIITVKILLPNYENKILTSINNIKYYFLNIN